MLAGKAIINVTCIRIYVAGSRALSEYPCMEIAANRRTTSDYNYSIVSAAKCEEPLFT